MKRTFLFLAAFAVVATSCSKNTLVDTPSVVYDASTINFNPSTGLSKATNTNNTNGLIQVQAGFEVFALVNGGKDADKKQLPDRMYFTEPGGTENTYTNTGAAPDGVGGTWAWGSDTGKEWPTTAAAYPMTFLAMVPAQPKFAANYAVTAPTAMNWEAVITQGTTTATTVDYLAAVTKPIPSAPLSGQSASLIFEHIMSQINFSVEIPTGYTVYVTKAIYHNLHNVNTYDFLEKTWTADVAVTAGTVAYTADNGAVQSFTGKAYEAPAAPAVAPAVAPDYASHPIAVTDGNSIKALPQYFALPWNLADFKKAAADWKTDGKVGKWNEYPAAMTALASGTYVELQYALVDANGVCVVGRIKDKDYIDATGGKVKYTGKDQFLRVAYIVDLSKVDNTDPKNPNVPVSDLKPGKKYTYQIALGTPNATGGTVLDPSYVDKDGGAGDDSGKEPGDDVNDKATLIGFTVDVVEWTDAEGSFEPLP